MRNERESVFGRPPNLDSILATLDAGGTFSKRGEGGDAIDSRAYHASSYNTSLGEEVEARIDEAQREAEVSRLQVEHLSRQLKGAMTELALHKRHAQEFKAMLEIAETDLAASHEHAADLSQKLQIVQEANRRNADMAQQVISSTVLILVAALHARMEFCCIRPWPSRASPQ